MLSDAQIERYSRQIILPQVGGKGQEKLLHARILVCGRGTWQTEAVLYLAAAGIGTIGFYPDRQIAGPPSSPFVPNETLATALCRLNPDCATVLHSDAEVREQNSVELLLQHYDLLLAEPNEHLHTASYVQRRPYLATQISDTDAWLMVCRGYERDYPCLWCAVPRSSRTTPGVESFSPTASFIGTLQATEAIKLILGLSSSERTKILCCNFPSLFFREDVVQKDPNCSFCSVRS